MADSNQCVVVVRATPLSRDPQPYQRWFWPGIMTHHVGYTLQFEQAMQRLAPSISMPYWEYTIEGTDYY